MAKAVRRRGSVTQPNGSSARDSNDIPQIQQIQDLIDLQKSEFEVVKSGYSQQNVQLARSNSSLMIKVREMDRSVSELIQENVLLRSKLSMRELQFKEKLTSHIQVMERGVLQRFDEILHMFASIRRREGLEPPSESLIERSALLNEPRSILKRNRNSSAGKSQHGSTIAFNENENQVFSPQRVNEASSISTRADHSPPSKRRRKSSRRESLFHPSDFEFSDHEGVDRETNAQAPTVTEVESPITLPTSDPEAQQKTNDPNTVGRETVLPNDSVEESCNFTNSLIDYSIPEEVLEASSISTPAAALNKVNVYHDSTSQSETELVPGLPKPSRYASHNFENESAQDKTTQQQQPSFIQNSTSSQKKVKHSMKARGAPKKMIDEVMPTTGGSTSELSDTSRSRRTRGKAINYALPSLRAKMRRPTEKLVDATTVTNIRDLQVRTGRRKSSSKSRDSTPFENGAQIDQEVTLEVQDKKTGTEHDLNHDDTPASPSKNLEVLVDSKRSSPSENTEPKSTTKSNPLKDITNNAPAKPLGKTKKLFKKPIVGDLGDENSYSYEESSTNRSMSFRVNEEDLSVFDLLDDLKTNTLPKTHRAKAKKVADKRGRKPAFRL